MSVVDAGAEGREDQQCRLRDSADDEARDVSSDAECDCNVQTLGRSAAGAEHARQHARQAAAEPQSLLLLPRPSLFGHLVVELFEKERTRIHFNK